LSDSIESDFSTLSVIILPASVRTKTCIACECLSV
jgi:hypothetical protein